MARREEPIVSKIVFIQNSPYSEWYTGEVINHSPDAIYAMTYFSRFFGMQLTNMILICAVNQARLNNHHFKDSQEEYNRLIYNYPAFYSESYDPGFEQIYLF